MYPHAADEPLQTVPTGGRHSQNCRDHKQENGGISNARIDATVYKQLDISIVFFLNFINIPHANYYNIIFIIFIIIIVITNNNINKTHPMHAITTSTRVSSRGPDAD